MHGRRTAGETETGRDTVLTEDLEMIQGAISAVVYQNYDNGYAVLR